MGVHFTGVPEITFEDSARNLYYPLDRIKAFGDTGLIVSGDGPTHSRVQFSGRSFTETVPNDRISHA